MTQRFKVDLRGIIDLAANHMYSSPDVFIRELVQNAVDAITARRREEPDFVGLIRVELVLGTETSPGRICAVDNGVGLSVSEVHEFLSTVGGSSKRAEAEEAADRIAGDDGGFLGRFGIGLLSCFMLTEEIVVVTRSSRDPKAPGVEWKGSSDGSYNVRELESAKLPVGTSVYITAKPGLEEYFEQERLLTLLRQYAEMMPVPIVMVCEGVETAVQQSPPPWKLEPSDDVALSDVCERTLGFRPIDAFAVRSQHAEAEGYLFVRSDRVKGWGQPHRLYAKGMLVSETAHGLMPDWASFVGCIINAGKLRLNASRESVYQDDTLKACREEFAAAIRKRLVELLRTDRGRFDEIMRAHDVELRGLALADPEFFEFIIDLIEFETTQGPIRFGEFRREHDRILLARTAEQYRRVAPVAQPLGLRVFNGGYTYHEELLARAVQRHPNLLLKAFDCADVVDELAAAEPAEAYAKLAAIATDALREKECRVVIRSFEPEETPGFFAMGIDAEFHAQLDRTKSMSSGLWREVLDAMAPRPSDMRPTTFCLNCENALVKRLARTQDAGLVRTAVEVLYVQSLMVGRHVLLPQDMRMLNGGISDLLSRLAQEKDQ